MGILEPFSIAFCFLLEYIRITRRHYERFLVL